LLLPALRSYCHGPWILSNSLQDIISSFHIYFRIEREKGWVLLPLTLLFRKSTSNSMHRQSHLQNSQSFLLSSSDNLCILSILLLLARYVNAVYLVDQSLLACRPIKFNPSHKPTGRVMKLCCFGQVNGVPFKQMQRSVNAGFGLFTYRNQFIVFSLNTTLRSSRIAAVSKTQLLYCTQFAEQFLRFTLRILALRLGIVGIRPRKYADLNQAPRL
jgi:hypothetical protein